MKLDEKAHRRPGWDERSAADWLELADGQRWAFPMPVVGERVVSDGRITIERAAPTALAVDATGVGRAVVDRFQAVEIEAEVYPLTITAGHEWRREDGQFYAPKKDLVGAVEAGLQSGTLKIVKVLELAKTLESELLDFKLKISLRANELFGEWCAGQHDDLVVAFPMAPWLPHRGSACSISCRARGLVSRPVRCDLNNGRPVLSRTDRQPGRTAAPRRPGSSSAPAPGAAPPAGSARHRPTPQPPARRPTSTPSRSRSPPS